MIFKESPSATISASSSARASSTNIFRDIGASLRDIVGGRSGSYEKKMNEAREIAFKEMEEKAQELGADAVVGVDIDYETVGNNMMMVSASGTAVKLA